MAVLLRRHPWGKRVIIGRREVGGATLDVGGAALLVGGAAEVVVVGTVVVVVGWVVVVAYVVVVVVGAVVVVSVVLTGCDVGFGPGGGGGAGGVTTVGLPLLPVTVTVWVSGTPGDWGLVIAGDVAVGVPPELPLLLVSV